MTSAIPGHENSKSRLGLVAETLYCFTRPSNITNPHLNMCISRISKEVLRSLAYALTCWFWMPLCEYTFSLTMPPAVQWTAFFIHLAFYFRLLVVSLFTVDLACETYRYCKDPLHCVTYHQNVQKGDHPLLHYFWFDCGCDPNKLTEDEAAQIKDLIEMKGFAIPKWDVTSYVDYQKKPKRFKRKAFEDFQTAVQKHHAINFHSSRKPYKKGDLNDLLTILSLKTEILSHVKKAASENSPLYELSKKVIQFQKQWKIKKTRCLQFHRFLTDYDWHERPSLKKNLFFLYQIRKFAPFARILSEKNVDSPFIQDVQSLSQLSLPLLPTGPSLCLHFKTTETEKAWETALKTGIKADKWYWHADLVFWENLIKEHSFKRVGLVRTGYLRDNLLRPKHWNTAEFYQITLPPGLSPSLQKKAYEIFLSRMHEMAKTKGKWKSLEIRNTFIFKRHAADFSYFPFGELYLLVSILFYHKKLYRHWNPETFDVTIPRRLWCSEFLFFLIIDGLQEVNKFLDRKEHPRLPYPVDGYENTAGITPDRLKSLLMKADMLTRQFAS